MVAISNYSSPQFLLLRFTIFNTNILWSHSPHENYNILPFIRNLISPKKINIPNVSCKIPFLNIPKESYKLSKTGHLPYSMRLAMKKSTWTFQMYCELFWEVKLNMQTVLCNLYGSEWNASFLQNLSLLALKKHIQYMV